MDEGAGRHGVCASSHLKAKFMIDLIYVAAVALIFVVGELYAWWCEKL
jgi:hypothetical protein